MRAGSLAEWERVEEVSFGRRECRAWLAFCLYSKVLRSGARKRQGHGQAATARYRVIGKLNMSEEQQIAFIVNAPARAGSAARGEHRL